MKDGWEEKYTIWITEIITTEDDSKEIRKGIIFERQKKNILKKSDNVKLMIDE